MTDLQAAIGLPQLDRYDANVAARRANAEALTERLAHVEWLDLPRELPRRRHVWHQFTVLIRDDAPVSRNELIEHLARSGVGTGVYYPRLVHDYDCYRNDTRVTRDPTPRAAEAARRCLSLPIHPRVSEHDLDRIADALCNAERVAR
jgi:dTDP-4-amino-4,6-dideoxygalactose transaminase